MVQDTSDNDPVIIKKYANRRLYNTETSSYVTLEHLCHMVKEGREFVVRDAKTGEDITRSVLTQIMFEEESKGETMLPINFLRQIISFYGGGMQSVVPTYLEATMEMFAKNQERYQEYFEKNLSAAKNFPPAKVLASSFEEITRQNMAALEQATRMFSPFGQSQDEARASAPRQPPEGDAPGKSLDELREQLRAMQDQLDALSRKGNDKK